MRKLITVAVSAAALGGLTMTGGTANAATAAPAAAASAAPAEGPARAACALGIHTYQYTSYRGGWKEFCTTDSNLKGNKFNNGRKVNDNIRSVKNTSRCTWHLFQNRFGFGHRTSVKPRKWDADLRNNSVKYSTSSLYRDC